MEINNNKKRYFFILILWHKPLPLPLTLTHTYMTYLWWKLMWPKFYLCPHSYCLAGDLQRHTVNRKQQGLGLGWNVGHLNLGFCLFHTQLQLSTFPLNTKHFVSCHRNQPELDFSILAGFVYLPNSLGAFQYCINQYNSELSLVFLLF